MKMIAIFGLGGVGAYLGARLANFYGSDSKVAQIDFIARGETLSAVRRDGIILEFKGSTIAGKAHLVCDNPAKIGLCDYILFCAKNYSLDSFLEGISPCVGKETVLVPFANGIEAYDRISATFPENFTAPACAYIISQIVQKGRVMCTSANPLFLFGKPRGEDARLSELRELFKAAGINAKTTPKILERVWRKFAFISPLSTAMSNYGLPYAKFRKNEEANAALLNLLSEFCKIAKASLPELEADLFDSTLADYDKLMPSDSTTSMQRDFMSKRKSELDSLTGYICQLGRKFGIDTPVYDKFYEVLKQKETLSGV